MRGIFRAARVKETLFGMFYVMTDGRAKPSPNAMRNLIILFLIDFGQVLRVMLSPMYGWNRTTYDVAKHVDVVYNTTKLFSFLVPRYTFFALAFLLVGFAIGNAVYCARLFKAGEIKKIGPLKALRFMVAVVVTTLFSSTMKWLLIPLECLASNEESLSSYIHGEEGRCTPWTFPEIMLTVPTLVLIPFYVAFALTASLFALGTNPLSCAPHVQFTGRVEVLFILGKVLSTFLVFVSDTVTPVTTTTVLFFFSVAVLYRHLAVLPFHHKPTNVLRGGIYTAICWLATTSLIVSTIKQNDLLPDGTFQTMQWLMVGFIPVSFTIGRWFVHLRYKSLLLSIDRLRGEFELTDEASPPVGVELGFLPAKISSPQSPVARRSSLATGEPSTQRATARRGSMPRTSARARTNYDNFFDPSWERKRAFGSGQQAHTVARMLLMQRQEGDLPFLAYVIFRSLEEFPESQALQVFRLSLLRFVFHSTTEAASEEKQLKSSNVALAVDHEYVLYAVERKATQDYAASNMGNGQFNAINLMEFDSGMQTARQAHLHCVVEMRKFWDNASSRAKKKDFAEHTSDSVVRLLEFNKALEKAQQEYAQLLEKYPQSVQLLLSYASFCDAVLNDIKQAEDMRRQAALLEGGGTEEEVAARIQDLDDLDDDANQSVSVSEAESFRLRALRQFNEYSKQIFGVERRALHVLDRRLKVCFVLLLAAALGGFLVLQLWLFRDMAFKEKNLINLTGLLRAWAASGMFLIRTQHLHAVAGNAEGMGKVQGTIRKLAGNLQAQHWDNYEIMRTQRVKSFYLTPHVMTLAPDVNGWQVQNSSFWHFGNDWSRRMERATTNTVEDLQDQDWSLQNLNEGRANMQYMMENGFRSTIPELEEIVIIYEEEMKALWTLTQTVVAVSASVNVGVIAVVSVLLIWGVKFTVQRMQHMYLACVMAVRLPTVTTKKVHGFYKNVEQRIRAIEDDEDEQWGADDAKQQGDQEEECDDEGGYEFTLEAKQLRDDSCGTASDSEMTIDIVDKSGVQSNDSEGVHVKPLSTCNLEKFKAANSPLWAAADGPAGGIAADGGEGGAVPREEIVDGQEQGGPTDLQDEDAVPHLEGIMLNCQDDDDNEERTSTPEAQNGVDVVGDDLGGEAGGAGVNWSESTGSSRTGASHKHTTAGVTNDGGTAVAMVGQELPLPDPTTRTGDSELLSNEVPRKGRRSISRPMPGALTMSSKLASSSVPDATLVLARQESSGESSPKMRGIHRESRSQLPESPMRVESDVRFSADSPVGSKAASRGRRNHGRQAEEAKECMPLNEMSPDQDKQIRVCLSQRWPLVVRSSVHALALACVMGIGLLGTTYPARGMDSLVTLAPTINQAGRRRFLTRSCVHLSRELVLDDGFSRMSKRDIASALNFYLQELRRANDAVRLGGDLSITVGADFRNKLHNEVMYGKGCPWREDPTDCSTPERPNAAANGLYHLSLSFMDAVGSVLKRYGPPPSEYTDDFLRKVRLGEDFSAFENVTVNPERRRLLEEDQELVFILNSFSGDMFTGFALLVEVFDEELEKIIAHAMADNQNIFIVYMIVTFGCSYLLFRRAMAEACREADKARAFVARIPAHALSQLEIDTIAHIFSDEAPAAAPAAAAGATPL